MTASATATSSEGSSVALEITLRKQLAATEERLQLIVSGVEGLGFLVLTPDGLIDAWNLGAERMFGYAEQEIVGQPFAVLFTPEDAAAGVPERELALAAEQRVADGDCWHLRKDGTRFFASGVTTVFRNGHIRNFAKLLRDQTQAKLAEQVLRVQEAQSRRLAEELADANRRKDEFLAMLGHELRNPLTPICTGLYMLEQKLDQPHVQTVRIMLRQIKTMVRLVDDLLDVSRITRGKIQLCKEPLSLAKMIDHALETVRPQAAARLHQLTVQLPQESLVVEADPLRLEQVLVNLLGNAIKYTPPGGQIQLSAELRGNEVVLSVSDNGVGITADLLPHVFDLFAQAPQTLDRAEGGLGIGLTLAKQLLEFHGGTIEASSPGLGRGSEFIVRLPAVPRAALPPEPQKLRVLVVDDVGDVTEMLTALLKDEGFDAYMARTGDEALNVSRRQPPDVGLLDIGLPGMNGYELAQALRQQVARELFLVAVTGYGDDEAKQRSKEAGFDLHITKPLLGSTMETLLAALRQRIAS